MVATWSRLEFMLDRYSEFLTQSLGSGRGPQETRFNAKYMIPRPSALATFDLVFLSRSSSPFLRLQPSVGLTQLGRRRRHESNAANRVLLDTTNHYEEECGC